MVVVVGENPMITNLFQHVLNKIHPLQTPISHTPCSPELPPSLPKVPALPGWL